MLAEVKRGCPAWLGLLHPHSLLDTNGVLALLGGGDSNKVLGIDPSRWKLVCREFSDVLRNQILPLREPSDVRLTYCLIQYHLLIYSIKYHLWNLLRLEKPLDRYLSKG